MLRVCHETTSVELADSDGELASQRTCRQLLACYGETRSRHCAVGGAWQAVGQPETTVQFKFESRVQVGDRACARFVRISADELLLQSQPVARTRLVGQRVLPLLR
jgi:hypothetical protein